MNARRETFIEALNCEDKVPVSNFIKIDVGKRENSLSVLSVKRKRQSAYIEEYFSETEKEAVTESTETDTETYLQSETSEDEYHVYPVERTT
jgi:hypothetical protein